MLKLCNVLGYSEYVIDVEVFFTFSFLCFLKFVMCGYCFIRYYIILQLRSIVEMVIQIQRSFLKYLITLRYAVFAMFFGVLLVKFLTLNFKC